MTASVGREIIVCLDGTTNTPQGWTKTDGSDPSYTNVYKVFCATKGGNRIRTYVEGIGGYGALAKPMMAASGQGLWPKLTRAYQFVVAHYEPGDRVFIFGFSRGAYTARHLAGLITRVGLSSHNLTRTHRVIEDYVHTRSREGRPEDATAAPVQFLGLWDAVAGTRSGLTAIRHDEHHDGRLEAGILHAAHAVALDERRISFLPEIYERTTHTSQLEQRLFPGGHSDVGGGNSDSQLSDAALEWMIQRAERAGLAPLDLPAALREVGMDFNPGSGPVQLAWGGLGLSRGRMKWLTSSRRLDHLDASGVGGLVPGETAR